MCAYIFYPLVFTHTIRKSLVNCNRMVIVQFLWNVVCKKARSKSASYSTLSILVASCSCTVIIIVTTRSSFFSLQIRSQVEQVSNVTLIKYYILFKNLCVYVSLWCVHEILLVFLCYVRGISPDAGRRSID